MGKIDFNWNEETGLCSCAIVLDDFLQGFGIAECHPQDSDVKSRRTGEHIAELRAQINLLQNYKNRELRPGLKALLHLKGTMVNSFRYIPTSYEAKRLDREIKNFQKDIAEISRTIHNAKQELYDYINTKETMAQRHRAGDKEGYKDSDTDTLLKDIEAYERIVKNNNDK